MQDAMKEFQADLSQALNKLISDVLTLVPKADEGTRIIDVVDVDVDKSASTPKITRRISTSSATTIDIVCPDNT
jgi:hypothetical protein